MRPCASCGHRSDPTVSKNCPECGVPQLPREWSVLLRECPASFWILGHAGSLTYLAFLFGWILSLWTHTKGPNIGAFTYLAIFCFPISIAHLRGKRLDDVWIITETRLEHRPRVGSTTFHAADEGWSLASVTRKRAGGHLWRFRLERLVKGRRKSRADLILDDRDNDPAAIEATIRRVLTPASASDT